MRSARPLLLLAAVASCSGPSKPTPSAPSAMLECPAPIGSVPREDCSEIADDFGSLDVAGALKVAGSTRQDEERIVAIKAAGALAKSVLDQRVALCDSYDKCSVPVKEHHDKDEQLTATMRALIELWNNRNLSHAADVEKFRAAVAALDMKLNGPPPGTLPAPEASPPSARVLDASQVFARVPDPLVSFAVEGPAIKIEMAAPTDAAAHRALAAAREKLGAASGRRLRARVNGTYTPASAPLIAPGDEIGVKLKFNATTKGEIFVALRSLEEPDAPESTTTWSVAAGDKGDRAVTLTAAPQESGFFIAVGMKTKGDEVKLDDIEVSRAGKVIAAARAEDTTEPALTTSCSINKKKAIAGKASFDCLGGSDAIAIGAPQGHLSIALVQGSERVALDTLSLDGGRSVDAVVRDQSQLVIELVGRGSATIRSVELVELPTK